MKTNQEMSEHRNYQLDTTNNGLKEITSERHRIACFAIMHTKAREKSIPILASPTSWRQRPARAIVSREKSANTTSPYTHFHFSSSISPISRLRIFLHSIMSVSVVSGYRARLEIQVLQVQTRLRSMDFVRT